jgi:hypothetical protein
MHDHITGEDFFNEIIKCATEKLTLCFNEVIGKVQMELSKWLREVLVLLGRMCHRQARRWESITTRITQAVSMRNIIKYQHLHPYLLLNELHSQHCTEAQNTAGVSSGIRSELPHRDPMAVLWSRPTAFVDIRG